MHHGLDRAYLYSVLRLDCTFADEFGNDPIESFGSGFIVEREDHTMFLFTCKHVLDPTQQSWHKKCPRAYKHHRLSGLRLTYFREEGGVPGAQVEQVHVHSYAATVVSDNLSEDVVVVVDPTFQAEEGIVMNYTIPASVLADEGFLSGLEPCDFLAFPGHSEYTVKGGRPVVRVGTVASDPTMDFSAEGIEGSCVAYEAFSTGGNSGSPVFSFQKGIPRIGTEVGGKRQGYRPPRLVGVNSRHLVGPKGQHGLG